MTTMFFREKKMKKNCSFAGPLANVGVPELRVPNDDDVISPAREDPAVFGERASLAPVGAEVEFFEDGRFKVVKEPE
jgi:hypothetical protein